MLAKSEEDYPNDRGLHIMVAIVLVSSAYIALVSMALEVVIMLIIMIFMTLAIFLCFWCFVFCPRWLAWRPRENMDVDRQYFIALINGNGAWEHVLHYIYKHKRRHFKAERYRALEESEPQNKDVGDKPEEVKNEDRVFENKDNENLETDRDIDGVHRQGLFEEQKMSTIQTTIQTRINNEIELKQNKGIIFLLIFIKRLTLNLNGFKPFMIFLQIL